MLTTALKADPRAVAVARTIHRREQPELTILFGSRARGDYREPYSDIDIMLVQPAIPNTERKEAAESAALKAAEAEYQRPVETQLIWRTVEEFRFNRRYRNSLETRAVHDGVIMPRNSEEYGSCRYEDESTESAYDWKIYELRLRHAEVHLTGFQDAATLGRDDLLQGQQAQNALEHGMKALLEALQAPYRHNHNLGHLLGTIRHYDPAMRDFALSIPPDVYSAYEGSPEYVGRTQPRLTEFPDYFASTVNEAQRIIDRAREVRESKG